jgi:hypothetical protein
MDVTELRSRDKVVWQYRTSAEDASQEDSP